MSEDRSDQDKDGSAAPDSGAGDAPEETAGAAAGGADAAEQATPADAEMPASREAAATALDVQEAPVAAEWSEEVQAGGDDAGAGTSERGASEPGGSRPGGRGPAVGIALALLIGLGAVAAAGYLYWRLEQLTARVDQVPEERARALEPLATSGALEAVEQRFDERLRDAVEAKAEELAAARQEGLKGVRERLDGLGKRLKTVEQGVREVRELAARDQIGWRLAEIRYLLGIAQRRLAIAQDTRTAIAALESADRAIAQLGSVRLLPLRRQIVEDLTDLRAVETADVDGIALRLQNLLGRVADLPQAHGDPGSGNDGDDGADAGAAQWWSRLGEELGRYISIHRRDAGPERGRPQPATGLPAADRLVLALERARTAALARNPDAYQRALERAGKLLREDFDRASAVTERFAAGLDDLRERPVETQLPDLTSTLRLAKRLSARLESEPRAADAPAPQPGDDGAADAAPADEGG